MIKEQKKNQDLVIEKDKKHENGEDDLSPASLDTEELGFENSASIFLQEEVPPDGFLPEAEDSLVEEELVVESQSDSVEKEKDLDLEGTELDAYDSIDIEEVEMVSDEQLESILESILFASDRPVSLASIKMVFKGTNIRTDKIRRALDLLAVEYSGSRRGVILEQITGGYQLRTKVDNLNFLRRTLKTRAFKLSGPALEVLSIVAYKQPVVKSEIDEIRGVESGHLLRALMEKGLCHFEGKSDLPGRPMQYGTTRKFLEVFGLRNIKELPTLSEMDQLLPEGIGEEEADEKQTLSSITDSMSETIGKDYSTGEEELLKIEEQLGDIETSSQFFEDEKRRQREKKDQDRAQNIREALVVGDPVSTRDQNWLRKYDEAVASGKTLLQVEEEQAALKAKEKLEKTQKSNPSDDSKNSDHLDKLELSFSKELEILSDEQGQSGIDRDSEEDDHLDDELPFLEEADEEEGGYDDGAEGGHKV